MTAILTMLFALSTASAAPAPDADDTTAAADAPAVRHTYTCLGRQSDPDRACRRLQFERGAPTPEGYALRNRAPVAPLAIGSALFGGAYLTRLVTTEARVDLGRITLGGPPDEVRHLRWHYAPIVGPWAVLAADAPHGTLLPSEVALGITDGILQGVGAALIIWSVTHRKPEWVKGRPVLDAVRANPKRGGMTITLDGRF